MKMMFLGVLFVLGAAAAASPKETSFITLYGINPFDYSSQGVGFYSRYPVYGQRSLSLRDVYERPIVILASTSEGSQDGVKPEEHKASPADEKNKPAAKGSQPAVLTAFYADNGLGSVSENKKFSELFNLFKKSSHLNGIVFFPKGIYGDNFLNQKVDNMVLPDVFNVFDFVRSIEYQNLPVVYLAPKEEFNRNHFPGLRQLGRFSVQDDFIEPYNVYDGAYPPFYGDYQRPSFKELQPVFPKGEGVIKERASVTTRPPTARPPHSAK